MSHGGHRNVRRRVRYRRVPERREHETHAHRVQPVGPPEAPAEDQLYDQHGGPVDHRIDRVDHVRPRAHPMQEGVVQVQASRGGDGRGRPELEVDHFLLRGREGWRKEGVVEAPVQQPT